MPGLLVVSGRDDDLSCGTAGQHDKSGVAVKEDVLEQVVDDYLRSLGFLTHANLRFRPSPAHPDYVASQDSGWSDIDVIGYCPMRYGADRVWVVSCKSWQTGLDAGKRLDQLRKGGDKEARVHREVWMPKWGAGLCDTVEQLTGQRTFRFFTAVTKLKGVLQRWHEWRDDDQIRSSLEGNWVGFLRLEDMWRHTLAAATSTLAPSVIGRLAQMLLAAGQATVGEAYRSDDLELTHPHEQHSGFPSLGGMWLAPPIAADCDGINFYGHTVDGYRYAAANYNIEPSPEALWELRPPEARWPSASFELLRLAQFYDVRSWHHAGMPPDPGTREFDAALTLHLEVQRAWVQRRFDRVDVPRPVAHPFL